jgi:antitoxin HicB
MSRFAYPATIRPDKPGFVVTFDDFGVGVTHGDTREEALAWAVDLLETIVSSEMADNADIPLPSAARGRPLVSLSPLSSAKLALYLAMREAGMSKAELCRRLGWHMPQVARLLDLRHSSRLDLLDQALAALGKRLVIDVRDAA